MTKPTQRGSDLPAINVTEIRDQQGILGLDPDTVEKGKHYRWVGSSSQRVARHKMRGYRFVTQDSGVTPIIPVDDASDGTIRVGDMVLMECDADAYAARRQNAEDVAATRTKQAGDDVRRKAKKKGIRTFKRDADGDDDD